MIDSNYQQSTSGLNLFVCQSDSKPFVYDNHYVFGQNQPYPYCITHIEDYVIEQQLVANNGPKIGFPYKLIEDGKAQINSVFTGPLAYMNYYSEDGM